MNMIGRTVESAHKMPNTQINLYYPIFFLLKKLRYDYRTFIEKFENGINIFNSPYPQQLFKYGPLQVLISEMKEVY
jgi:hypothetical protein